MMTTQSRKFTDHLHGLKDRFISKSSESPSESNVPDDATQEKDAYQDQQGVSAAGSSQNAPQLPALQTSSSTQHEAGQDSPTTSSNVGSQDWSDEKDDKIQADRANGMQAPAAKPVDEDRHMNPAELESGVVRADTQDTLGAVRTISKVPGNDGYYEKGGLRTYGDGQDHLTEPPMTFKRFMIFVAMGFLWTGSQIPLYLFGGIIPIIIQHIGGGDRYVWIALGNLIPLACVTPFVGALSDLFGRKNIAMFGATLLLVGSAVCGTAHTMNIFIAGQAFIGVGAAISEFTALAVAGESAPTKKRGIYIGGIIITILPYCPSVMYSQLIAHYSSWRYVGLWCGLWSLTALILTAIFYWPPSRANSTGLSKWTIAKRIDYVGGLLFTSGFTLFLMGLTWAGNQYQWMDNHVLVTVILGGLLVVCFAIWEIWFVPYPMFPRRLAQNPLILTVILIITFVSGANFFAVLVFWPVQYYAVYTDGKEPVRVGEGSLPVGFCIIGGSIIFSVLISIFKGRVKLLMVIATVIMAAGNGAMAAATVDNLSGVYVAVSFACLGVGAVIVPNQIIASVICPDDLIATVTALTISVRVIGGAIAYAIYYNLLRRNFIAAAFKYIAPTAIHTGVLSPLLFYHIVLDISNTQLDQLRTYFDEQWKYDAVLRSGQEAFAASYPIVYYVSIAFGGVAIIASIFLPNITRFMDNHVAVSYIDRR